VRPQRPPQPDLAIHVTPKNPGTAGVLGYHFGIASGRCRFEPNMGQSGPGGVVLDQKHRKRAHLLHPKTTISRATHGRSGT
jgi:hypothetical protein